MSQQAEWMAVRAAASSALFHIQGIISNQYGYSFESAVQNFETAVKAWDSARTPAAAAAAVSAALIGLEVAPYSLGAASRPSPEFQKGAERIVTGLQKIVNETR